MRRVPAVRHEEEAGGALQGTRRLPPRDALDRDHGVGLPRQVEDDGEEAGRRVQQRQRGLLHLGIMVLDGGAVNNVWSMVVSNVWPPP